MNRESQLESALRESCQLANQLLLYLSVRGMSDEDIQRAEAAINKLAAVADPPPDNVIPFPKRS